jgi:succinate dehydrogenase / fumarate reductase cytochrome b subunit
MANFWYQFKFGEIPWKEYTIDMTDHSLVNGKGVMLPSDSGIERVPQEHVTMNDLGQPIKTVIVKDLYEVVRVAFGQSWLVVFYVLGMIALAYHLVHGFQSGFQSLGLRHPLYTPVIQFIGVWIFGIIIPMLFAAMPVYFFFFRS